MASKLAAAALILSLGLVASPVRGDDLKVKVGFQPGTAPRFFVARDQDMFKKAGLAADFIRFTAGPAMLAALKSEDIDIAFMTTAPAIFGLSQGLDLRVFFIESDAAKTQALVSTGKAAMKSLADQKGRRIGVTFGTSAHYALLKSLKELNLSPESVKILDMQPSAMLPAFIKGDIDGAWSWDPWTAKMENEGGHIVGSLGTMRLPMAGVWVGRTKWLSANEPAVQRFIKAMDQTTTLLKTKESAAVSAISEALGVDAKTALQIYRRIDIPPLNLQLQGYIASLGTSKTKAQSGMAKHMSDLADFFYSERKIPVRPDVVNAIDPGPVERYLATK
jgi:taurine ABC transporter substrate-binding protein